MTATVQEYVSDKGEQVAKVTTNNSADVAVVNVDGLVDVTITVRRSAGAGSDTLAVTGGADGTNFGAVVAEASTDVALTALTSAATLNHKIRQKVRFLKFTSSGTTDTWEIHVYGVRR